MSNHTVKFKTIELPIKYIDHDKKTNSLTDKAKFGIQFFTTKDGLPDEALSSVIYVNSARHLRNIKVQLRENLEIPKGQFFVVLKAVDEDNSSSDKSKLMLNPYLLSNTDGVAASWLFYDEKTGRFTIRAGGKDLNANINIIFKLSLTR